MGFAPQWCSMCKYTCFFCPFCPARASRACLLRPARPSQPGQAHRAVPVCYCHGTSHIIATTLAPTRGAAGNVDCYGYLLWGPSVAAFADDLMFFLKATVDHAWAARQVLDKCAPVWTNHQYPEELDLVGLLNPLMYIDEI